jgi:hypothetical protein
VGLGALLGSEHLHLVLGQQLVHDAVRVIQVAEDARAAHAGFHAGGQQAFVHAVRAERAFVGLARLVVDEARVIGQACTQ